MRTFVGAVLVAAAVCVAQDEGRKFDVYGFMDLSLTKLFVDDSHILWSTGRNDLLGLWLSHFNIYGDWRPAPGFRVLSEVRVAAYPDGTGAQVGTVVKTNIHIDGYNVDTTTVYIKDYPVPAVDNTVEDDHDGPTKWGSIVLERAWMEYQFGPKFAVRAGKFITPAGIWNVDHGSPVILTARQPYQTNVFRMFPRSQVGVSVYGALFAGNADVNYEAYVSGGREELSFDEITDVAGGANIKATLPLLTESQISIYGYTGMRENREPWRHIDIDVDVEPQLRLYLDSLGRPQVDTPATAAATDSLIRQVAEQKGMEMDNHTYGYTVTSQAREVCLGISGKFALKGLSLQGEFNYQQQRNQLRNDALTHVLGYYGLLSYRIAAAKNLSITPYVMAERLRGIDTPNNPQYLFDGTFLDGFVTVLGGVNVKFYGIASLKLEYGYIRMNTLGEFSQYESLYDINLINGQISIAF